MTIRCSGWLSLAYFQRRGAHTVRGNSWRTRLAIATRAAVLSLAFFTLQVPEVIAGAPASIIHEFGLERDGDVILVPVTLSGRTYLFAVDTGASCTAYDTSLADVIGGSSRIATLRDAGGRHFSAPSMRPIDAFVHKLRLPQQGILVDLAHLRQAAGYDIRGLLGMDFLGQYIVRLNFDAGKFQILAAPERRPGREIPLTTANDGLPYLRAEVPGVGAEWFLIDTGSVGVGHAGNLRSEFRDHLLFAGRAMSVATGRRATAAAPGHQASRVLLDALRVGAFHHRDLAFGETEGTSTLGNDYWSRYVVTFDFPRERMFLKESRRFAKPVLVDKSGLHLLKVGSAVAVDEVDHNSPGAQAGVRRGDVVISVGNLDAQHATLRSVRRALCDASGSLPLTIERSGARITVSLRRAGEFADAAPQARPTRRKAHNDFEGKGWGGVEGN